LEGEKEKGSSYHRGRKAVPILGKGPGTTAEGKTLKSAVAQVLGTFDISRQINKEKKGMTEPVLLPWERAKKEKEKGERRFT